MARQSDPASAGGLFLASTNCACSVSYCYQADGTANGSSPPSGSEADLKQVENGGEGYSCLFWAGPEGSFRADGKYGQFVILMRDKNAVVTVTAESRDAGALLRAVFEDLPTASRFESQSKTAPHRIIYPVQRRYRVLRIFRIERSFAALSAFRSF